MILVHICFRSNLSLLTVRPGENTITRKSEQSTVTTPYERTFRKIGTAQTPATAKDLDAFRFCGCGWPNHMLLPKGAPEGVQFDLYVMISDYTDDSVNLEFDE